MTLPAASVAGVHDLCAPTTGAGESGQATTNDSVHAAHLVRRSTMAAGNATMPTKPVRHSDNSSTVRATMLQRLGVKPS